MSAISASSPLLCAARALRPFLDIPTSRAAGKIAHADSAVGGSVRRLHRVHERFALAAVDVDLGAGDEGIAPTGEEGDQVGHFFGTADAAHRDAALDDLARVGLADALVLGHLLFEAVPAVGIHGAGVYGDDLDVVLAVLFGQRDGDRLTRGVGRAGGQLEVDRLHAVVAYDV